MKIDLDGKIFNIEIEYKQIKNMYLRIKDENTLYITAPIRIKKDKILEFICENKNKILKMISKKEITKERHKDKFLYLGNIYDYCYINEKGISFGQNKVFINKNIDIDKWYKSKAKDIFLEHLDNCYDNFSRKIPYPSLKVRKMKTRWGVCNTKTKQITLNLELIKLDTKYLDYVINHELSHLIYPNHSDKFWSLVEENNKDYKKLRKEMKNIL